MDINEMQAHTYTHSNIQVHKSTEFLLPQADKVNRYMCALPSCIMDIVLCMNVMKVHYNKTSTAGNT